MENFLTNAKRIILAGTKNFFRNGWLNIATTSIMTLTLIIITILLIVNVVLGDVIEYLENRLDISVYFNAETTEDKVLEIKREAETLPEITQIEYVSKDEGIVNLLESNNLDERNTLQKAIEEIGTNPLMHTLNVQTRSAADYNKVSEFFEKEEYQEYVSKVKIKTDLISKVNYYSKVVKYVGFSLSGLFALISILITFNAIRITIHNFRSEIEIMRLVGASNWFIRLPFMVEGILYGFVACVITILLLYPIISFISPKTTKIIPNTDILKYFNDNFILVFLLLLFIGISIGSISSLFAIRRHLKEAQSTKEIKDIEK